MLVNNAGTSQRGAFESITDELWQDDIDLKLFAAIRLARLALPGMKARRFGRIINVLNTGAKAPPAEGAPTAVTRAAGMALTKVLAGEGAKHNVLVNGLLVGRIESDQWVRRHATEGKNRTHRRLLRRHGQILPMGRLGTAQEFANAALFLASDAGSYITGTAINVDGGLCPWFSFPQGNATPIRTPRAARGVVPMGPLLCHKGPGWRGASTPPGKHAPWLSDRSMCGR